MRRASRAPGTSASRSSTIFHSERSSRFSALNTSMLASNGPGADALRATASCPGSPAVPSGALSRVSVLRSSAVTARVLEAVGHGDRPVLAADAGEAVGRGELRRGGGGRLARGSGSAAAPQPAERRPRARAIRREAAGHVGHPFVHVNIPVSGS